MSQNPGTLDATGDVATEDKQDDIIASFDKDYFIEVARGNISGQAIKVVHGRNPAVGTIFEDIWDAGALQSLAYDAQSGNFTVGLTITGGTSNATARIVIDDDSGTTGTLTLTNITGTFQNDETITDSSTGSATSNGVAISLGRLTYPTSGETWEILSDSANDTSAGTGARTVKITYLDDTFTEQTETKTMNGITAVAFTATDAFRFISAQVLTWGTTAENEGNIIIRVSGGTLIRGMIEMDATISTDTHGLNSSLDGHFTVPAGKTALFTGIVTNVTKNHDVAFRLLVRAVNVDGFVIVTEQGNYQNNFFEDASRFASVFAEKTDIKAIARSNNTSVPVNFKLGFLVIDN